MKKKWKKFSEIYRFRNLRESFVEQIEIKQNKIALEICDSETDENNKWGESWKYSEKKKTTFTQTGEIKAFSGEKKR